MANLISRGIHKRWFLFYFLFLFLTIQGFSQSTGSLSGRVYPQPPDTSGLPGATVLLQSVTDTLNKTGTTTNLFGNFRFDNLQPGEYQLNIRYLGFKGIEQVVQIAPGETTKIKTILLPDPKLLQQVEIQEVQTRVSQKGDTTEINAASYQVNPDASTGDLVRKMPGIIFENGVVKAQGEEVKKVLVDGTEFFGEDAKIALENLPAEVVDKIQIIDRQSDQARFTGFNDGETEKTINIVTKEGKNRGVFGSVYAGYGTDDRYHGGGNINIFQGQRRISILGIANNINQQNFSPEDLSGIEGGRSRNFNIGQQSGISTTRSGGLNYSDEWGTKWKVSGSYFYNESESHNSSITNREYGFTDSTGQYYSENLDRINNNQNHRLNARLEFSPDSSNSFIFTPSIGFQNNTSKNLQQSLTTGYDNQILNQSDNNARSSGNGNTFSNGILYRHKFGKTGRTISARLNTSYNEFLSDQQQLTSTFYQDADSLDVLNQEINNVRQQTSVSGNISYTEPIGENNQIQLSYSPSISENNSERLVFKLKDETDFLPVQDTSLSNLFENRNFSHQTGFSFKKKTEKHSFIANLDYQMTGLRSDQIFPSLLSVNRNFHILLPRFVWMYSPAKGKRLRAIYNTRSQLPSVIDLQNVIDNSNPIQLRAGNPNLSQSYSHSFTIRYNHTVAETSRSFNSYISATSTQNHISRATYIGRNDTTTMEGILLPPGTQLSIPVNINGYFNLRSFFSYGLPVTKIKSNVNLNLGYNFTKSPGVINGTTNISNSHNISSGVVLGSNISPAIDFSLSYNFQYNLVGYSLQKERDNNFISGNFSGGFNWTIKNKLVVSADAGYNHYSGLNEGFNQDFLLVNSSIGYKFLKNNAAEIRIAAYDLLNQNTNISRNITETFVEDVQTNVLQRYLMVTLVYNLKNFSSPAPNTDPPLQRRNR